jgi:hypothetical protein
MTISAKATREAKEIAALYLFLTVAGMVIAGTSLGLFQLSMWALK